MQQLLVDKLLQVCCVPAAWSGQTFFFLIVIGLGVLAQQRCLLFLSVICLKVSFTFRVLCRPLLLSAWHTTCTLWSSSCASFLLGVLFFFSPSPQHVTFYLPFIFLHTFSSCQQLTFLPSCLLLMGMQEAVVGLY